MPTPTATILTFADDSSSELLGAVLPLPYLAILHGASAPTRVTVVGWNVTAAGFTTVLSCALARALPSGEPAVLVWPGVTAGVLRLLDHIAGDAVLGLACDNHPVWPRGYNVPYLELTLADLAPASNQPDLAARLSRATPDPAA